MTSVGALMLIVQTYLLGNSCMLICMEPSL
uniref:Uncharacterized protein n=1 Tax=virus sp. ctPYc18 TaxID=2828251 RepID=A0A8S5RD13_9VIRU|nr:MAG TPA: hypothetical protein [virus sp. ctPYc18]